MNNKCGTRQRRPFTLFSFSFSFGRGGDLFSWILFPTLLDNWAPNACSDIWIQSVSPLWHPTTVPQIWMAFARLPDNCRQHFLFITIQTKQKTRSLSVMRQAQTEHVSFFGRLFNCNANLAIILRLERLVALEGFVACQLTLPFAKVTRNRNERAIRRSPVAPPDHYSKSFHFPHFAFLLFSLSIHHLSLFKTIWVALHWEPSQCFCFSVSSPNKFEPCPVPVRTTALLFLDDSSPGQCVIRRWQRTPFPCQFWASLALVLSKLADLL